MKKWLSYIVVAMVCGLCLSSCTKDDEVTGGTDDGNVPVRLTLSFSNFEGRAASEPGSLDYTTTEQSTMSSEDIYVLVVDASDNFLYQIEDLKLGSPIQGDNYYTRSLEGTMLRTIGDAQVKLVVLANLKDNKIPSLNTRDAIRSFIDSKKNQPISTIYDELIYHYDGSALWNIANRAIPMWGSSGLTKVPGTGLELTCKLYRAVAKVGIWVNMKDGIPDFTITKIVVNNANDRGYCVSKETPNNNESVQYSTPSVPVGAQKQQPVTYDGLSIATAYENEIYLPEQVNTTDADEISLTVYYTYNGKQKNGIICFRQDGTGDKFDIVRNHSYIFNILISDVDANLYYIVTEWEDENIDIPAFN